jgi:heptaprenyl diphosphate synthase
MVSPQFQFAQPAPSTAKLAHLATVPQPTSLSDIFQRADLLDDLAATEQLLLRLIQSQVSDLTAAGEHMIAAGGKRLRAALVLLAARLGEYDFERASHPAAAVELLHTATLVHDDLVDHTPLRRNRPTIHTRWGNTVALMLGDFFFGLSAHELSVEKDARVIRFYADAAQTIVEGELSPVKQIEPLDVALEQYRYKIGCKTAVLFEASCKAGIAVANGTPEQIEALGRFGFDLGLAFQIIDDILDFTGDEQVLGKPAGNDLREGTWTLPLIYALAETNNPILRNVVKHNRPAPEEVPALVNLVIESGGAALAMEEALATIDRALSHLNDFPDSKTKRALYEICQFVLQRRT